MAGQGVGGEGEDRGRKGGGGEQEGTGGGGRTWGGPLLSDASRVFLLSLSLLMLFIFVLIILTHFPRVLFEDFFA